MQSASIREVSRFKSFSFSISGDILSFYRLSFAALELGRVTVFHPPPVRVLRRQERVLVHSDSFFFRPLSVKCAPSSELGCFLKCHLVRTIR